MTRALALHFQLSISLSHRHFLITIRSEQNSKRSRNKSDSLLFFVHE
ncbi:Uncharacterised protein [Vibrio cholerae]|nr:Uncharacterised protein [Vibrio cholerae]CSD44413.1 Uncharacterised protein [Vibrio cholerae]CSI81741.1 Uncharacterised protein [Vibrio cholerae]